MRTSSATATPSASTIAAPSTKKTTAPRTARAAARKAETWAERRDRLASLVIAFLEERRPGYFTTEQIGEGIGAEDLDALQEVLADGLGERWDGRTVGTERNGLAPHWEHTALLQGQPGATARDRLLRSPGVALLATRRTREWGRTMRVDLLKCTAPGRIECFVKVASDWNTGELGEHWSYLTEGEARGLFEFYPTDHSDAGWAVPAVLDGDEVQHGRA